MNLPNTISAARIAITPLIAILPFLPSVRWRAVAFVLFLASAISDHVDGRIARSRGLVTDLGKLLDPLADKLLVVGTFIPMFILQGHPDDLLLRWIPGIAERSAYPFTTWGFESVWFPWWVLVLILGREGFMTWFRGFANARGVVIAAQALGKWKTVLQFVWMGAAYFWFAQKLMLDQGRWHGTVATTAARVVGGLGSLAMLAALVLTLVSLTSYLVGHRDVFTRPRAR